MFGWKLPLIREWMWFFILFEPKNQLDLCSTLCFLGTPIDLSSLVFDENILSPSYFFYCFCLLEFCCNSQECENVSYSSSFILKMFLFIFTKFAVQAYILSIAIKSLMFYVVFHDMHDGGEIFNLCYCGIRYLIVLFHFSWNGLFKISNTPDFAASWPSKS